MTFAQLVNLAFEAIMNGASSVNSVVAYILTVADVSYNDATTAAETAFRQIHEPA